MTTHRAMPVVIVVMLCAAHVTQAVQQQIPTFRARADAVAVNVVVRDKDRLVAGLGAQDFELFDNGVRQDISSSTSEQAPIDVTLLLDTSASVEGEALARLKRDVQQMSAMLKPDDRIRLLAFASRVVDVVGLQAGNAALPLDRLTAGGSTSLQNALASALMIAPDAERVHLAFAMTDGAGTPGLIDPRRLVELARLSSATMYVALVPPSIAAAAPGNVAARVMNGIRAPTSVRWRVPHREALEDLVKAAGGRLFEAQQGDSLPDLFRRVLQDFRQSYVLRYTPRGVAQGGWHELAVSLPRHPQFLLRFRNGYEGG